MNAAEEIETEVQAPCQTIRPAAAAAELGVSIKVLMSWARAGHLPMFVPPGKSILATEKSPGPKGYRIFRDDWERFKADRPLGAVSDVPKGGRESGI